jgi:regulator of nucleoside diphosphate kinase
MVEPFISLCPEITRDDAYKIMQWLKDDEVIQYLSDTHETSKSIQQMIDRVNNNVLTHIFNQNGRFFLACDKQDVPVGFVRLVHNGNETEIVIVIGESRNFGKRLGTSTIRESMKIAFFELRTQRLIARIHKENKRSINAFLHAGFKLYHETETHKCYAISMEGYMTILKEKLEQRNTIYMTELDNDRLKKLIDDIVYEDTRTIKFVNKLNSEIGKAKIVDIKQISRDVVTMHSKVLLHVDGDGMEVDLVYPNEADIEDNKLSVLSPIGTAILGHSEGESIKCQVPSGETDVHIKKIIYQPEAAGDYHL